MNGWRALGHTVKNEEVILYVGISAEQVKKNYSGPFYEQLTNDEQASIRKITLEKWSGKPDSGRWLITDTLRVPRVYKTSVSEK
jgi:hypothetical protein